MTDALQSSKRVVEVAVQSSKSSAPSSYTVISGASGLEDFNHPLTSENRVIPGMYSGVRQRQPTDMLDYTLNFTVDYNTTTDDLFHGPVAGRYLYWNDYPEGKSNGKPKISGRAIIDSVELQSTDGVLMFNVQASADGTLSYGTQS